MDSMATADVDMDMLLQRFPSVAFERREPEPGTWRMFVAVQRGCVPDASRYLKSLLNVSCSDPHKSTKGWVARSPKRIAAQSDVYDCTTTSDGAYSSPEKRPAEADFVFGSPSERFPLFEAQALDVQEVDEDSDEVS